MTNYAAHFARRGPTPQTQPIPGREAEQVENNAGGFVFEVGDFGQLDRFLILGSEGGSYYVGEREMTIDNAKCVVRCIAADGPRTVARIVEISDAGRAPKNDPALFALALCASADDVATRQAALRALPQVARIGTHLFKFAEYVQSQRGWGRALRRAIGDWYNLKPVDDLAYQAVKYQQREGWSNRDLLRLSHPETTDDYRKNVYDWICGRKPELLPNLLSGYDMLKANPTAENAIGLIQGLRMPREGIPTELLNDVSVWKALLEQMPVNAMIRNLGKMTAVGALDPMKPASFKRVVDQLADGEAIRKARQHPLSTLIALRTYAQGHGEKGKLSWRPVPRVIDALDGAFYLGFKAVEPTNTRILIALDVSGSMGGATIAGTSLTAREGSAALALVTAATEQSYLVVGFTSAGHSRGRYGGMHGGGNAELTPLPITPRMRLDDVTRLVSNLPFGGTDCALPWLYAIQNDLQIDAVITITDNETWACATHPTEAARKYREKTGIAAKNIVIGMTSTGFTINDPADPLGLDVVGFDTSVPALISDFIRG